MASGVPQGSILIPFSFQLIHATTIFQSNNISCYSYAENTWIYISLSLEDYGPLDTLHQARHVDVVWDSDLNFSSHIKSVIPLAFYQLKIQPILKFLHWLPLNQKINFKILLLVHKSLTWLGPNYVSDMFSLYELCWKQSSCDSGLFCVTWFNVRHMEATFVTLYMLWCAQFQNFLGCL